MASLQSILDDPSSIPGIASVLRAIESQEKFMADLELLYVSTSGIEVTRDAGLRVRGPTVYSCSRIGTYLTNHFKQGGEFDKMMWVGFLARKTSGKEYWITRPVIRKAIDSLSWFEFKDANGLDSDWDNFNEEFQARLTQSLNTNSEDNSLKCARSTFSIQI